MAFQAKTLVTAVVTSIVENFFFNRASKEATMLKHTLWLVALMVAFLPHNSFALGLDLDGGAAEEQTSPTGASDEVSTPTPALTEVSDAVYESPVTDWEAEAWDTLGYWEGNAFHVSFLFGAFSDGQIQYLGDNVIPKTRGDANAFAGSFKDKLGLFKGQLGDTDSLYETLASNTPCEKVSGYNDMYPDLACDAEYLNALTAVVSLWVTDVTDQFQVLTKTLAEANMVNAVYLPDFSDLDYSKTDLPHVFQILKSLQLFYANAPERALEKAMGMSATEMIRLRDAIEVLAEAAGAEAVTNPAQMDLVGQDVAVIAPEDSFYGRVTGADDSAFYVDEVSVANSNVASGETLVYIIKTREAASAAESVVETVYMHDRAGFYVGGSLGASFLGNKDQVFGALLKAEAGYTVRGWLDIGGAVGALGVNALQDPRTSNPDTLQFSPYFSVIVRTKLCRDTACYGLHVEPSVLPKFGATAGLYGEFGGDVKLTILAAYTYQPTTAIAGHVNSRAIGDVRINGPKLEIGVRFGKTD